MIDSSLFTLLGVAFVAAIFVLLYFLPLLRMKDEIGKTPLLEERCSGWRSLGFGLRAGGNIPMWRISCYEDFCVVASIRKAKIAYEDIESVEYGRQLISKGIRIRTRDPRVDTIVFPKNPHQMIDLFRKKIGSRLQVPE